MNFVKNSDSAGLDTLQVAEVTDHPFVPRDPDKPWGKCRDCDVAEAAHQATTQNYSSGDGPYRCPRCVEAGISPCTHTPEQVRAMLVEPKPAEPEEELPRGDGIAMHMAHYEEFTPPEPTCDRCGAHDNLRPWGYDPPLSDNPARAAREKLSARVVYFCTSCWSIMEP